MSDVLPGYPDLENRPDKNPVPIDLTAERNYDPSHVTELARTGEYLINGERLKVLHDLGCAAEQLGALRTMKGGIVITLDGLTRAMTAAQKIVDAPEGEYKIKERLEAGRLLGYLAGQLSKVTSGAVKMDRDVAEVVMEADQRRRNSFQPGQAIDMNAVKSANPPKNS